MSRVIHYVLEGAAVLLLAVLAALIVILHLTRPEIRYSQQIASLETTVRARVRTVGAENITVDENGLVTIMQELELQILSKGDYEGRHVTVTYNGMGPTVDAVRFRAGQQALVMISKRPDGQAFFQVADHVRLTPIALIVGLFVVLTLVIGRGKGMRALLGLALSGLVVGGFILPQVLAHRDPTVVSLVGTATLLAVTLYLIQGWNPIGHTALLGMLAALAVTGALSVGWTKLAYLTGFGSEETMFLQAMGVGVEMRGLLLAGIIIGTASVLDDVVLAQAVTVFELAAANPTLSRGELYHRGMKIGVAHLASMINTLVLAYASAALPLLLLFYLYPEPWYLTINRELIAEEIVRTLVGSVGLMMAVPLTTAIAAWGSRG
ncbi:MAG TPA: YibE/F family protein [Anaerolineae bacterium]|mgnify:CR=1 FL=1|nr:YibE/F family protein [Anaerolineae bacterium]